MLPTPRPQPLHFDDLLSLDPAPANDVDRPERTGGRPTLHVVSWGLVAHLDDDSEDGLYAGLSYDVSVGGGVFVATVDTPPVGAPVDLKLILPDGSEVVTDGVVRWIRDVALASDGLPAGCGVECTSLPVAVRAALAAFAEKREPLLWVAEIA